MIEVKVGFKVVAGLAVVAGLGVVGCWVVAGAAVVDGKGNCDSLYIYIMHHMTETYTVFAWHKFAQMQFLRF